MHPLLEIKDLSWSIETKNILKKLNWSLYQGEILGIIGPNGAGKTSLLRCIIQHITNYQGTINFAGKNISTLSRQYIAQHIAVVNQVNEPVFKLCVIDVIRMGLLPYKALFSAETSADTLAINQALEKTDLTSLKNEEFTHLSGGEQQRTLIARALVQKTDVLILDEPTNHLDVYYQHQILQLVKSLNLTVIMTIHDLNLAHDYCSRLLLLDKGKLIADGAVNEVLEPSQLRGVFGLPCQPFISSDGKFTKIHFQASCLTNPQNDND